jgi:hypothetical protein
MILIYTLLKYHIPYAEVLLPTVIGPVDQKYSFRMILMWMVNLVWKASVSVYTISLFLYLSLFSLPSLVFKNEQVLSEWK